MSDNTEATAAQEASQATTTTTSSEVSLLDQAISATKQTDPDRTTELLQTLTSEALSGTVVYSKSFTTTINAAIEKIDAKLSKQLAAIMHHPDFTKLEGSWRGLSYLVMNSETSTSLKLKVINCTK
jgi:type VI secretion system protein ImpC